MDETERTTEKKEAGGARGMSVRLAFLVGMVAGVIVMAGVAGAHGLYAGMRPVEPDPSTKVAEIYSILSQYSMFEFEIEDLLNSMYRGLIQGLGDANAQYLDAESNAAFMRRISGVFVGIGVQVVFDTEHEHVTIVNVFRGAPASEAGLLPGDRFVEVDGVDVAGMPVQQVVSLVGGDENTSVSLRLYRPHEGIYVEREITRRRVEIPSVHYEMREMDGEMIGHVQITTFDGMTHRQFQEAVARLLDDGARGFVVDLRNNSGGLLDAVSSIGNMLVPEGIVTYTVDGNGDRRNYYSDASYLGLPLVVLVNGHSASASEILAGAVRDLGAGTILGENTFGKGTVQSTFTLSDNSAISITVRKYFTPNGESIDGIGIAPDVVVEMDEETRRLIGALSVDEDGQLHAALRLILTKFE